MTPEEATIRGLANIWTSTGSRKQNALAHTIVDALRIKGVDAEVVTENTRLGTVNSVWRDKAFEARCKKEYS